MRSLSGVKPTGSLHIGNYFGAIKQFIKLQNKYEGFYFVADYHSLNTGIEPKTLQKASLEIISNYLALGLDPDKSTIFLQSQVPEVAELTLLLGNITPMGLLQRAHSYKDKIAKDIQPNHGLFSYPLLMASDILLYDSDLVPVGRDQKQHLEITRDIAIKFNNTYNQKVFKIPEPLILDNLAVVKGTDGRKMSKSYGNVIEIFAPKKKLKKQVMGIITDSIPLEQPKDPDKCNVFSIYKLFSSKEEQEKMRSNYLGGNYGYGHAKLALYNKILAYFERCRIKKQKLEANPQYVKEVLEIGSSKARNIAIKKISKVKKVMGLIGNIY
ncbi:MAG: tryptophan--tRNA ligase [Deltaproteobacteria bacterium]|jgi:tryptophanyl-tRNA synthetase|nr:tryptophan--tRNA ligase [Deltaproteobacteria bacterium]